MLICPVCGEPLEREGSSFQCRNRHSFDIARENYVNLLRTSKKADLMGDDKISARSRRDFLNRGYYSILKDALCAIFEGKSGTLLDICCGEGYYTSAVAENKNLEVYGFDLSREMVRLAAKRGNVNCFVANMASIPVRDASFDYAMHLFAPFNEAEFSRVLKPGGKLYSVVPGANHLLGLKELVYENPYLNDEKLPETAALALVSKRKVCGQITLKNQADIEAVFRMTPYYFHTRAQDREKITAVETLDTPVEFVIGEYTKLS